VARERIDLVLSGGGTLAACHVGALAAVLERYDVPAIAGTSAGSIVAAGHGIGMSTADMLGIFKGVLADPDVLDRSWFPLQRWGVYKGDRIYKTLQAHFNIPLKNLKRDCRIVVCDLWTRQPVVVSAKTHPDVVLADAVRCSIAIPGFFKAHRLEPGNARLYVDGGVSMNFAHAVFDDLPERTIGARFAQGKGEVNPVRSTADYVRALAGLLMYSSDEAHISSKRISEVVTIKTKGNGLDFSLTPGEIDRLYRDGYSSMRAWIEAED